MEPYIYRTSVGSRMRSIEWWHFQWPWWTPNPVYKVTWSQSQKRCILRTSFYRTLIGNHSQSMEWYHFQWPWVTRPRFQGHDIFEVEKWRVLKRKSSYYFRLIGTIPNIWNGTMFGDLDWPLNASRRFVSISWASCLCLNIQARSPAPICISVQLIVIEGFRERTEYVPQLWNWENHS